MKMPTKGSLVYIEDGGAPLFVGGIGLNSEEAEVMLKYEGVKRDDIVTMDLSEFQERRIYPEQLPTDEDLMELIE